MTGEGRCVGEEGRATRSRFAEAQRDVLVAQRGREVRRRDLRGRAKRAKRGKVRRRGGRSRATTRRRRTHLVRRPSCITDCSISSNVLPSRATAKERPPPCAADPARPPSGTKGNTAARSACRTDFLLADRVPHGSRRACPARQRRAGPARRMRIAKSAGVLADDERCARRPAGRARRVRVAVRVEGGSCPRTELHCRRRPRDVRRRPEGPQPRATTLPPPPCPTRPRSALDAAHELDLESSRSASAS